VAEIVEATPIEELDVVVFRPGMTIDEMERQAIAASLNEVHGNRRKAAELLGIGERTLYRKIAKYGLEA
jgi:DNA-binding NtrC family response regulator